MEIIMSKLTIHTATYNRAYILPKAYESLKAQTCKDFEWIITDDGSTDNTEELVNDWIKQDNGFPIVYLKLSHVGLNRALNVGVDLAKGKWYMRLDSDDYILPQTVEKVLCWVDEIKDDDSFAGIGFARAHPDGRFMKDQQPIVDKNIGYFDATHLERKDYHIDMDMCEVHRTSVMTKYPHPVWEGEMFAPEQLVLYKMALEGYKLRWRLEKLYICEYLPIGLTNNNSIVKQNPMGFAMMYNQNMLFMKSLKDNINNAVQMTALSLYAGHPEYLKQSNKKALTFLTFPIGWIWSLRRKRQFAALK